ncbi:MAG: leucine-rich repeat protein [Clostridiales bacterium]|nr:leucine-rich repeat protein [Clostridiales bacterium]
MDPEEQNVQSELTPTPFSIDDGQIDVAPVSVIIKGTAYQTNLERIDLRNMQLTDADIQPLAYMTNLRWLNLENNQINDISALTGLTKLTDLYLSGNPISGHVILNDVLLMYNGPGGDVVIPEGVKRIAGYAFGKVANITGVFIPDSVTGIIEEKDFPYIYNVFLGCKGLINITVSENNPIYASQDGVLFSKDKTGLILYPAGRIGDYSIPDGVKYIAGDAYGINSPFVGDGLTGVLIPESVEAFCWTPFGQCSQIMDINVSPDNGSFSSQDGVLYNKDKTRIIAYPTGRSGDFTIPDGVTDLEDYAFFNCQGLTSVVIPEGVTHLAYTVGDYVHTAFVSCANLVRVVIPRSVSKIDDGVFYDCPNIVIYSYADSEAQRFAEENQIPFVEIGS